MQSGNYEVRKANCTLMAATIAGVKVVNVYIPNGQSVGSRNTIQNSIG